MPENMPTPEDGPRPEQSSDVPKLLPARPRRWRRRLAVVGLIVLLVGIGGELFARYWLGLGDPPLSVADPEIEYMFKPNMTYHRFGHRISYNQYSMRSGPVTLHKTDPRELRVLMVGDSVINGGAQTDDSELCSTLLQRRLAEALGRPVFVGNVSAGSWGPPNQLAYLNRFGWFDADVVVLVFSSHDYADAPTFEPLVGVDPSLPDHRPLLALQEGFTRYFLPRMKGLAPAESPSSPTPSQPTVKSADVEQCLAAETKMIAAARIAGARVIVVQHLEMREQDTTAEDPGHEKNLASARAAGIEPIQLGPAFLAAAKAGRNPYRDNIHPNAVGQAVMADVLLPQILAAVAPPAGRPATWPTTRRLAG